LGRKGAADFGELTFYFRLAALTVAIYPDIRDGLKELRSMLQLPINAQVVAFALRALRKRLAKQKHRESSDE
jgi:hypothetical protein